MKSHKFTHLLVIGLALTCAVAGCVKKPVRTTELPGARTKPPGGGDINTRPIIDTTGSGVNVAPGGGLPAFPASDKDYTLWGHNSLTFEAQTVYFDYDSVVIKSGEKSKIQVVAAYLQANPRHAVLIEGNCDERGTEEYNRSLGERRALAVREDLIISGVAPERAATVSYGEDRPADAGHTKEAWDKNRRGAFVLLTPPQ
jgi:peptidoglycan-associated lipoprotein